MTCNIIYSLGGADAGAYTGGYARQVLLKKDFNYTHVCFCFSEYNKQTQHCYTQLPSVGVGQESDLHADPNQPEQFT